MPISALTREDLIALDRADTLASFRERFSLPAGVIYLDGNSLGAMPRATAGRVSTMVEQEWGTGLIRSWNDAGWMDLPGRIADKIGRLIGAVPGGMAVGDSTSVNLFKLLGAALAARPERRVILTERGNFPTDLYIAQGLSKLLAQGHEVRMVAPDDIAAALDDSVAVLMLTHVNYHTGAMFNMSGLTEAAHAAGALTVWDLAHSAGAVPVDLAGADADFAIGCGYKYLNGGPGAPAFLYVAPRLLADACFPITGWWGHAAPFSFEAVFRPADGIARATVGTAPIISIAALEVGVDLALEAPMAAVRAKSVAMTDVFARLVQQRCAGHGLEIISPADAAKRGSQVSVAHPNAYPVMQALIAHNVIGDFRAPDVLRFGMTPLYLGFAELWDAVEVLRRVLAEETWKRPQFNVRRSVT